MPDHATFLRAIIAAPDDDYPRLVYADWLDDRGDPRGEFIRVQIALEKTPKYDYKCDVSGNRPGDDGLIEHGRGCYVLDADGGGTEAVSITAEYDTIRSRERELLRRGRDTWALEVLPPGLRILDHGVDITFRRGFVEAVTCALADWLAHGPAVVRACPVSSVTISDKRPEPHTPTNRPIRWSWYDAGFEDDPATIPQPIFGELLGPWVTEDAIRRAYESESAAALDLSNAALEWAKAEADERDRIQERAAAARNAAERSGVPGLTEMVDATTLAVARWRRRQGV